MKNLWRALSHSGEVSRGEGTQVPREKKKGGKGKYFGDDK